MELTFVTSGGIPVTQATYGVAVEAVSAGGIAATLIPSGGLPITITNGILLSNSTIAENSANGTTLGTASVPATYSGAPVWSLTDVSGTFQINSSTGVITVLSNTALNYEVNTSLPITISVSGVTPAAPNDNVSVVITNVVETPVNTVLPVILGTAQVGQTLGVTNGTWTDMAGPGTATYSYQWKRGGVNIASATASTYTLVHADDGAVITCAVTATNTAGNATATSAGTSAVVEAPSNTVAPSISGTAQSGQTLTATTGTWQGDATITYAYQWQANGANIAGANSSTFVLTNTQVGTNITCVVTGTNSVGSASATSNSLGPITSAPTAPSNTVAPVASGSATIGSVLSVTNGTWTGTPTITYTYQWNNGADIAGATSSAYTVQSGDNGLSIFCKVTGTNGVGNSTANSNSIGPIGSAPTYAPTYEILGF